MRHVQPVAGAVEVVGVLEPHGQRRGEPVVDPAGAARRAPAPVPARRPPATAGRPGDASTSHPPTDVSAWVIAWGSASGVASSAARAASASAYGPLGVGDEQRRDRLDLGQEPRVAGGVLEGPLTQGERVVERGDRERHLDLLHERARPHRSRVGRRHDGTEALEGERRVARRVQQRRVVQLPAEPAGHVVRGRRAPGELQQVRRGSRRAPTGGGRTRLLERSGDVRVRAVRGEREVPSLLLEVRRGRGQRGVRRTTRRGGRGRVHGVGEQGMGERHRVVGDPDHVPGLGEPQVAGDGAPGDGLEPGRGDGTRRRGEQEDLAGCVREARAPACRPMAPDVIGDREPFARRRDARGHELAGDLDGEQRVAPGGLVDASQHRPRQGLAQLPPDHEVQGADRERPELDRWRGPGLRGGPSAAGRWSRPDGRRAGPRARPAGGGRRRPGRRPTTHRAIGRRRSRPAPARRRRAHPTPIGARWRGPARAAPAPRSPRGPAPPRSRGAAGRAGSPRRRPGHPRARRRRRSARSGPRPPTGGWPAPARPGPAPAGRPRPRGWTCRCPLRPRYAGPRSPRRPRRGSGRPPRALRRAR